MTTTETATIHQPEAADARSLSDQAYYRLRELIVTLELPPGSILNERELMRRLGLGRTPVREALRTLAREKLVEVYPRRGIFVSGVDVRDLAGLSEVRVVLEPTAARLAAERVAPDQREAIDELLGELAAVGGGSDERALMELDQRVHRQVYRSAGNAYLEATLNEYYVLSLRIWFLALGRMAPLDDAVREHRELLEAIRDGRPDAAEDVMRRHIVGFERAMREVL